MYIVKEDYIFYHTITNIDTGVDLDLMIDDITLARDIATGLNNAYDKGYDDGYNEGHGSGYSQGMSDGECD